MPVRAKSFFLLSFSVTLVIIFFFVRYIFAKTAFIDDVFINLHIAANIAEHGTANYSVFIKNGELLSTTPIKAYLSAAWFGIFHYLVGIDLRTVLSARLNIILSCLSMLALLMYALRARYFDCFIIAMVYLCCAIAIVSFADMEGFLIFTFILLSAYFLTELKVAAAGLAIGCLVLSRPDLGGLIAGAFVLQALVSLKRAQIARLLVFVLIPPAVHLVLSIGLGVYPIPSSIWTKELTSKIDLVNSERAINVTLSSVGRSALRLLGSDAPADFGASARSVQSAAGLIILVVGVLSMVRVIGLVGLMVPIIYVILLARMPAHFIWYFDNLTVASVSFALAAMLYGPRLTGWVVRSPVSTLLPPQPTDRSFVNGALSRSFMVRAPATCAVLLLASVQVVSGERIRFRSPWDSALPPGQSRYAAYIEIARLYRGEGQFDLPRYGLQYVRVCEIGIIYFFAGKDIWATDMCGLAQVGNFREAKVSNFRYLYPGNFLRTGADELRERLGKEPPFYDVWAREGPSIEEALKKCAYADIHFCINPSAGPYVQN